MTLVGLLLEAHRGLARELELLARRRGLSGVEFSALLRTSRSPGSQLRMSDLAAQVGLSTSGATTLVERLMTRELLQRAPDPGDRRALVVTLTPTGSTLLDQMLREQQPVIDRCLIEPLGADLRVFTAALLRVRDVVEPNATQGAAGSRDRTAASAASAASAGSRAPVRGPTDSSHAAP